MLSRVKTGIEGFDELVLGGFPRGHMVLVTGGTGTGKSTFAMQFVYKGAKVYDEPGIYVTLEERIPSIMKNASTYGWDLDALEKKGQLAMIDVSPAVNGQLRKIDPAVVYSTISTQWKKMGAKRIVVDPITVFGMQTQTDNQLRQDLIRFSSLLKELDATVIFVTEIPEGSSALSRFEVEEFIADGVVVLYYSKVGGLRVRGIEVRKMRGTSHKEGMFPIKIGEAGLAVYPSAKLHKL
ncbi:MAG TPA: ATPase domain-containing protein [Nitrososphaerales archaeon]|nr:ATPase domain-containing protein [Nitrososphaerales archaeon]